MLNEPILNFSLLLKYLLIHWSAGLLHHLRKRVPPCNINFEYLTYIYVPTLNFDNFSSIFSIRCAQDFNKKAYKAPDRRDLLRAINEFLDYSIVLPPGNWETNALLSLKELRAKNEAIRKRRSIKETDPAVIKGKKKSHLSARFMSRGLFEYCLTSFFPTNFSCAQLFYLVMVKKMREKVKIHSAIRFVERGNASVV